MPVTSQGNNKCTYSAAQAAAVSAGRAEEAAANGGQNGFQNLDLGFVGGKLHILVDGVEISGTVEPEPDEPDVPVVDTYTVTSGLTNMESTNPSAMVNEGESYTATLTTAEGYALDTVTVTMSGMDITAMSYADGMVSIDSVTGNAVHLRLNAPQAQGLKVLLMAHEGLLSTTSWGPA